jgi:hypothetical protein
VAFDFKYPGNNCLDESTGLAAALNVPAGMLMIKRDVFDRLIASGKIRKDQFDMLVFFENGMLPEEDTWIGEDNHFCRKWREIGGEIFIVPDITFTHVGVKEYKNNLHQYLNCGKGLIKDVS